MSETQLSDQLNEACRALREFGRVVDPGHWQGVETAGHPEMVTRELIGTKIIGTIPQRMELLAEVCKPNLPWAEIEFQERVGGKAHNPHESMTQWPWWHGQIDENMSHTYSERFWCADEGVNPPMGIRYHYGDLGSVVDLLVKYPHTRQATFPIFFPEDTGAMHGGRVPCTLHYHFLLRDDQLHLWYPIRSCDAVRHFRDDVYMAGRLCQWMIGRAAVEFARWEMRDPKTMSLINPWRDVKPGKLHFEAYSFHVHRADEHLL